MRFFSSAFVVRLLVLFAALGLTGSTFARDDPETVEVSGTVKDYEGRPVSECVVRLYHVSTTQPRVDNISDILKMQSKGFGAVQHAVSDSKGHFVFKAVRIGQYRYMAGNSQTYGFVGGAIEVQAGKPAVLDIKLPSRAK